MSRLQHLPGQGLRSSPGRTQEGLTLPLKLPQTCCLSLICSVCEYVPNTYKMLTIPRASYCFLASHDCDGQMWNQLSKMQCFKCCDFAQSSVSTYSKSQSLTPHQGEEAILPSLPQCGTSSFLSHEAGAGEHLGQNLLHRQPFPGVGVGGAFISDA